MMPSTYLHLHNMTSPTLTSRPVLRWTLSCWPPVPTLTVTVLEQVTLLEPQGTELEGVARVHGSVTLT